MSILSLGLLLSGNAFAEDAPPAPPAEETPAQQDCSELEGEEKTKCEEAAKAAEDEKKDEQPKKGGKASRSPAGNMEAEMDDE